MAKAKNSLVGNINRRKRLGISRDKASGSVSKKSYDEMRKGWPSSKKAKRKRAATKVGTKSRAKSSSGAKSRSGAKSKAGTKSKSGVKSRRK